MKKLLFALAILATAGWSMTSIPTRQLLVETEYDHIENGGGGNPPESRTAITMYYHGNANAWVEFYVDNYIIKDGYTNSVGNFTADAHTSDLYPNNGLSDCPHKPKPSTYHVVAFAWDRR